ncbi:hypothetical protein [uncultured Endozoicomonas sp.]|uniref:hypothetical protein n=1 Tax=uncultured Endozoicomonas sp. TaxID=432652 RepID=UPI0026248081|nr:hypothetical protein [uncultured Endozoicomonas sp.]
MPYETQAEALAHAILALMHGRVIDSFCYRNLIDNLYAFRIGAVNGTGKWDTGRIKNFCYWTGSAKNAQKTEKEHVIPAAEIVKILLNQPVFDIHSVYRVIDNYSLYCIVTPAEHKLLNSKFQRSMPKEFWQKKSSLYMDPWARYKLLGIEIEANDQLSESSNSVPSPYRRNGHELTKLQHPEPQ